MTVVILLAMAFASVDADATDKTNETYSHIYVSTEGKKELAENLEWIVNQDYAELRLNGVQVDYIIVESLDRPVIVTMNGDNVINCNPGGDSCYALKIISYKATLTGKSLKITLVKKAGDGGIGIGFTTSIENNVESKYVIKDAEIAIESDNTEGPESLYNDWYHGIRSDAPLEIDNSVISLANLMNGIRSENSINISNSIVTMENPTMVPTKDYDCYCFMKSHMIVCDVEPTGNVKLYDDSGEEIQWGKGTVVEITTVDKSSFVGEPTDPVEEESNDSPMKIALIACGLIAVFSIGYALCGKK